jgi:hypothetical protein
MEGAKSLESSPALLERYVVADEANDVARVPNRRDEILRERYGQAATSTETGAALGRPGPEGMDYPF